MISDAYLDEQRRLHARGYGGKGDKWAPIVAKIAIARRAFTVLDYGAGHGSLGRALRNMGLEVTDFDPAIAAFAKRPTGPFDMVVSTDVLEHVEAEFMDAVLDDVAQMTRDVAFLSIATRECSKWLSDGRNAHISVFTDSYWKAVLGRRFQMIDVFPIRPKKEFTALWGKRR